MLSSKSSVILRHAGSWPLPEWVTARRGRSAGLPWKGAADLATQTATKTQVGLDWLLEGWCEPVLGPVSGRTATSWKRYLNSTRDVSTLEMFNPSISTLSCSCPSSAMFPTLHVIRYSGVDGEVAGKRATPSWGRRACAACLLPSRPCDAYNALKPQRDLEIEHATLDCPVDMIALTLNSGRYPTWPYLWASQVSPDVHVKGIHKGCLNSNCVGCQGKSASTPVHTAL